MLVALTRAVSRSLAACQLTHLERQPINVERAAAQHAAYEDTLRSLGVEVVRVSPAPDLPDAVFVEDTALVLEEVAVIALPAAPSRRAETASVTRALEKFRPLRHLRPPATLDGGDVLAMGRIVYVGLSSRTNREAVEQLQQQLDPLGYRVVPVDVNGCLHLKSAVTRVGEGLLLMNPEWVDPAGFPESGALFVDRSEPAAANALWCAGKVVYPTHFPRTAERLDRQGLPVVTVDCSELAKAEGGVTCCSILFSVTE